MRAALFLCLLATLSFAAEPAREFVVGGFVFQQPAGWAWIVPSSPMRRAELHIVRDKQQADVVFFYFGPGQGGSVDDNVQRWLGQFAEPLKEKKISSTETGGVKVTFVGAEGTFQSGMPGGDKTPLTGYALRGAILEGPKGNVFVKLTAPKTLAAALEKDFARMVSDAAAQKL
jgi:hypothetical protein